jgi:murein DD-endopeptidase MepM/ murein hydrolase activator NlpD
MLAAASRGLRSHGLEDGADSAVHPKMTEPMVRGLRDIAYSYAAGRLERAGAALATTDGRLAVVSTGVAALVAGTIGLMAIRTLPVTNPVVSATNIYLPIELFNRLLKLGSSVPQLETAAETANAAATPGVETRTVTLDAGDTLAGTLEDVGISSSDANAAIAALGKDFNPRALKAGLNVDITYAVATIDASGAAPAPAKPRTTVIMVNRKPVQVPVTTEDDETGATPGTSQPISRLLALHFSPVVEQDITVTRTTEGGFDAQVVKKELQAHRHRAGGTVDSSLYLAAMQAGIPAEVVVDMINNIFSYKVDFQREVHPGDTFEVYYDYYYTPEGQPAKYGGISFARMRLSGKDIVLYRFQPDPAQAAEYFDTRGESAKGILMKTPVDGARISSGFGTRFHPVLGYTRAHKGVDFAVPVGTPVKAAGAGVVSFMGAASGYGNFLKIDMSNGWGTGYAHLSRFASGLRRGVRVRQGQSIR